MQRGVVGLQYEYTIENVQRPVSARLCMFVVVHNGAC